MFLLDKSFWQVRKTKSMGKGVFAFKTIEAGSVIGDYMGEIISSDEDDETDAVYGMWINDTTVINADAQSEGIHLINHSCEFNCAMYSYKGHVLYFATRKIFPGEQLMVHYLIDIPGRGEVANMYSCRCGTVVCRGTMHGTDMMSNGWGSISTNLEHELPLHTQLPMLTTYPQQVPDFPFYDLFGSTKTTPLRLKDTKLPDLTDIRHLIRTSGKRLYFINLKLTIHGIQNGMLILSATSKT